MKKRLFQGLQPIIFLTLLFLVYACATAARINGVEGIPVIGVTQINVGETSVLIAPQMKIGNGVVFVMEDGTVYWSKRFIQNDDLFKLLPDVSKAKKWVHLSPVLEHEIRKGDTILTCRNRQLFYLYY